MKRLLTVLCLALPSCAFSAAAPADLPRAMDLDQVVVEGAKYQSGQSAEPLRRLEDLIRQSATDPALRRRIESALIGLLDTNSTFEARAFACKQLGIVGGDDALKPLARLLHSDETCGVACLALTTYPHGKADGVLRRALAFAEGRTRVQIINTLGDRRDTGSIEILTATARGKDPAAAEAAIAALGKIGGDTVAKTLASLSRSADPALKGALAESSLRIAEQLLASGERERAAAAYELLFALEEPIPVRRSALAALLLLDKDEGESRMLTVLRGTNSELKAIAISRVASLPAKSTSSVFSSEIYHLQPAQQALLIESLSLRADLEARLTICTCLSSPDGVVRCAAARAIGRIGDDWYVPMLAHAATAAKSPEEKRVIENALAGLPGGAATDKAISDAISRSAGPAGAALMSALIRRTGTAANPMLISQLGQIDPTMARFAFRALGRTAGPEVIGPLLEALVALRDPEVRPEAQAAVEKVLERIPDVSRRSILLREALARADFVDSRCSLIGLLPVAADAAALGAVKTAAADSDPAVREAALRALGDWPDLGAWDSLAACYRKPEKESLRWVAMRGMVRLVDDENAHPGPQFIEHYRELVAGARNAADLKVILGALPGAANPEALQIAVSMLVNPAVRPEAELAVRRIADAIKTQYPAVAEEALKQLSVASSKTPTNSQ